MSERDKHDWELTPEAERQLKAIPVGNNPHDIIEKFEELSQQYIEDQIRTKRELIKVLNITAGVSPQTMYKNTLEANGWLNLLLGNSENANNLYYELKYRLYATENGMRILKADEDPKDGWLEINTDIKTIR